MASLSLVSSRSKEETSPFEKHRKQLCESLTKTTHKVRDYSALFFYLSARCLVAPLWKSTRVWIKTVSKCKDSTESTSHKIFSIAQSTLISCALLPLTLGGFALGQVFQLTAFSLATTPYIHLTTNKPPVENEKISVGQLNCCLTAGYFSLIFGGLERSNKERVKEIANKIIQQNLDIACLQEVSDLDDAFSLYRKLSSTFTEFYLNIGATPFILQNNSGLFVASKLTITTAQFESFSSIKGTESMVNKGYFTFSTKKAQFINTHLSPFDQTLKEIEQIKIFNAVRHLFARMSRLVFIIGDYNTDKGTLFTFCNKTPSKASGASCQTDALVDKNWKHKITTNQAGEEIDFLLSYPKTTLPTITTQVISTFDLDRPKEAISDHPFLVSTIG